MYQINILLHSMNVRLIKISYFQLNSSSIELNSSQRQMPLTNVCPSVRLMMTMCIVLTGAYFKLVTFCVASKPQVF